MRAPPLPAPGARRRGRSCGSSATTSTTTRWRAAATASWSAAAPTPRSRATSSTTTATRWRRRAGVQRLRRSLQLRPPGRPSPRKRTLQPALRRARQVRPRSTGTAARRASTTRSPTTRSAASRTTASWRLTRARLHAARPAGAGRPLHDNVVVHDDLDEAVTLRRRGDDRLDEDRRARSTCRSGGNRYDTDYTTELATGDFDGDGRTDVFVANGTGVVLLARRHPAVGVPAPVDQARRASSASPTSTTTASPTCSTATPAGKLGYVKSGTRRPGDAAHRPCRWRSRTLRFGDFDGDGLTDIFYTRDNAVEGLVRAHAQLDASADLGQADLRAAVRRVRRRARHRRRRGINTAAGRTRAPPPGAGPSSTAG